MRFLGLVSLGWIGVRIAILWPQTGSLPDAINALVPLAGVPASNAAAVADQPPAPEPRPLLLPLPPRPRNAMAPTPISALPMPEAQSDRVQLLLARMTGYRAAEAVPVVPGSIPLAALPDPVLDHLAPMPDRWSVSGWLVARPGRGIGAAPGGNQIGGSQAGIRLAYLVVPRRRIAAVFRVTTPLAGQGREAAIGLEWQPGRAPVRVVAEHRFGLDGTRGGPGAGIVAGIDLPIPADFRLEAYGQAGVIARARVEPYADGAARATRRVRDGDAPIAFGAGIWGAAQRDAQRLDAGPSATISVRNVRLSLDWRQRVAGDASPGSGPALTIGGDF